MPGPVNNVQRLIPSLIEPTGQESRTIKLPASETNDSFGNLLGQVVDSVNQLHQGAGEAQEALMAGEPVELHQVMIQAEMAGLSTDLLLEIRNRLVDGFNDIMRMPM